MVDVCVDGFFQLLSIQLDQKTCGIRRLKLDRWAAGDQPLHLVGESKGSRNKPNKVGQSLLALVKGIDDEIHRG